MLLIDKCKRKPESTFTPKRRPQSPQGHVQAACRGRTLLRHDGTASMVRCLTCLKVNRGYGDTFALEKYHGSKTAPKKHRPDRSHTEINTPSASIQKNHLPRLCPRHPQHQRCLTTVAEHTSGHAGREFCTVCQMFAPALPFLSPRGFKDETSLPNVLGK